MIASSRVELHPEGDTKPELLQVDISPPNIRVVNQGDSIVLDCIVHGWKIKKIFLREDVDIKYYLNLGN